MVVLWWGLRGDYIPGGNGTVVGVEGDYIHTWWYCGGG